LGQTKTANDFFAWFASPNRVAITDFLVKWGHLLIGLSLVAGAFIRVGASIGSVLMFIYYLAHLDFPYVENKNNFLVDYHLIYTGVLIYLVIARARDVFALDYWMQRSPLLLQHKSLRRIYDLI
jgi:thiosulfate dehydrogenase (quinone) large subunit